MSGWAGLAAGAGALGEHMLTQAKDDRKEKLAEKLRADREEMEEQRTIAREERAAARAAKKVSGERVVQRDGAFVRQYQNDMGETLKEEPLDSYEAGKLARKDQTDQLSLESLLRKRDVDDLELRRKEQELEDAPIKGSLDRQLTRSQIEANEARAERARHPATGRTAGKADKATSNTPAGLANVLVDEYDAEIKALIDNEKISATGARLAAIEAIKEAARRKVDARELFARQLSLYNEK